MQLNHSTEAESQRKKFEQDKRKLINSNNKPKVNYCASVIDPDLRFDLENQSAINILENRTSYAIVVENYQLTSSITVLSIPKESILGNTNQSFSHEQLSNSQSLKEKMKDYKTLAFSAFIKRSTASEFIDALKDQSGPAANMISSEIRKFMPEKFKALAVFSKAYAIDLNYLAIWDTCNTEDDSFNYQLNHWQTDIKKFLQLLKHYHGGSFLNRIWSLKLNRNHIEAVEKILAAYQLGETYITNNGQTESSTKKLDAVVKELMTHIGDNEINPDGDLAKALTVVHYRTGCDFRNYLPEQEKLNTITPASIEEIPTFQR